MFKRRDQNLGRLVGVAIVLLIAAITCLGAAMVKGLWWICGVAEWTELGPLPWGVAFFIVLVFGATGASSKS